MTTDSDPVAENTPNEANNPSPAAPANDSPAGTPPAASPPAAAEPSAAETVAEPANQPVSAPGAETTQPAAANSPAAEVADAAAKGAAVAGAAAASASTAATAAAASSAKVQIGSQRDVAGKTLKPAAVAKAAQNPVQLSDEPVPQIKSETPVEIGSMEGLSDDLEAEIAAALGGVSMDAVVSETQAGGPELEVGSRVKGSVTKTHGENVFMSLKGRFEGIVPLPQFKKPPADGDLVEVSVKGFSEEDGLYELSIPGAAVSVGDWDEIEKGQVVEALVTGSNTGGLEASVSNLRGFIPSSQIQRFRVEDFGEYVNKKLQCVVQEVNPSKKKLILSHRAILERAREEQRKEVMEKLEAGQLYDGTVTKLMDFGAFVDIGGVEGLVHVSKLSWDRVTHPKDVLSEGESVKVKIEKFDKETGKISLSRRDTMDHPWDGIESKYPVDSLVKGTVSRIADFGAFVRLEPGIEGLIHISELAHHRVVRVKNVVKEGDSVEVKVLSLDREAQKMGLSLKATSKAPERKKKEKPEEVDEPLRELAVKKQDDAPLKGGTGRKSGGEDIGLTFG